MNDKSNDSEDGENEHYMSNFKPERNEDGENNDDTLGSPSKDEEMKIDTTTQQKTSTVKINLPPS